MSAVFEETAPHRMFLIKTANEWMAEAKMLPPQKKLIGELFFENETTILFGETNSGKSIAAVQFADCISRGAGFGPLENTAGAQKVVYFDFELTKRQFSVRYTDDVGARTSGATTSAGWKSIPMPIIPKVTTANTSATR